VRELEFLPDDYLRARFQRRVGFIRTWLLVAIGLAMVLYSFQMGTWVRSARAELRALHGSGSAVEADCAKVRRLRLEARAYHDRIARARGLAPALAVSDVLADTVAALPATAVLSTLDMAYPPQTGAATVRLEGVTEGDEGVTRVVAALDASPRFTGTLLVESTPAPGWGEGARAFVIEADVACDGPRAKE
jgi:hypothetical protein